MNHLPDTGKMVSDTPRMKAAQMAAIEHGTGDVWRVGCDIERELNAANDRIKRLESAGNLLKDRYILENENWDLQTVNDWNEAKESNP